MRAFRPPADAWSRRDFMRNGSYSIALRVHVRHAPTSLQGPARSVDLGRAARAGELAVRALPARPADRPELAPGLARHGIDVYDVDIQEGIAEILPGFETPIYGYEGVYPGPTIRARKGRPAIVRQRNNAAVRHQRAPARRLRPGRARRPPDGRHRRRRRRSTTRIRTSRTPRSSGTTTTPTGARRGRSTTASSARTCSQDEREERARAARRASTTSRWCSPTTRSTRTARSATPRTSTSASAATRSWSTARSRRGWRVQRRIYRLRFLNASNARSYKLQARQRPPDAADRLRRRAARAPGRAHELPAAPGRADRGR